MIYQTKQKTPNYENDQTSGNQHHYFIHRYSRVRGLQHKFVTMRKYSRTRNYGDHDADNLTTSDGTHYTQPPFDYTAARKAFMDRWDAEDKRRAEMGKGTQGVDTNRVNQYYELKMMEDETGI